MFLEIVLLVVVTILRIVFLVILVVFVVLVVLIILIVVAVVEFVVVVIVLGHFKFLLVVISYTSSMSNLHRKYPKTFWDFSTIFYLLFFRSWNIISL